MKHRKDNFQSMYMADCISEYMYECIWLLVTGPINILPIEPVKEDH